MVPFHGGKSLSYVAFDKTRIGEPRDVVPFPGAGCPRATIARRLRGGFSGVHLRSIGGSPRHKMVDRDSQPLNRPVLPHALCRLPCGLNSVFEVLSTLKV